MDGKTHARYAIRAATVITLAAAGAAVTVHPVAMAVTVGAWVGVVCTPDLDHHVRTEDERNMGRINPVWGYLWSLYWKPYEWLNPHRGRSHTIPDGTLDRFLLCFWPLILLSSPLVTQVGPVWVVAWGLVLAGQMAVDTVHLWLDGLV